MYGGRKRIERERDGNREMEGRRERQRKTKRYI